MVAPNQMNFPLSPTNQNGWESCKCYPQSNDLGFIPVESALPQCDDFNIHNEAIMFCCLFLISDTGNTIATIAINHFQLHSRESEKIADLIRLIVHSHFHWCQVPLPRSGRCLHSTRWCSETLGKLTQRTW